MAYKPEIEMDCHYFDDDVGKSVAEIVESLGKELNEFFSDFSGQFLTENLHVFLECPSLTSIDQLSGRAEFFCRIRNKF